MFKPLAVLLGACALAGAAPVAAQTWPAKTIRIIIPFAAGGTSEIGRAHV